MKFRNILFKNKEIILLVIIFIIGLFLRTYNIKNTQWFSDTGRDILTAKHLVEYSENKFISPASSGGIGLKNSPLYYWFIAFLWLIHPSEIFIFVVFAFLGSLNIILAYILSKEIIKNKFTLVLPFFVSISNNLIWFSRNVWQPHLITFLQLFSFIFLFKGQKRKYLYLIALQISFLAFLIHYSFLPLLITVLVFVYADLYFSENYNLFIKAYLLTVINFLLYVFLTKSNFNYTRLYFTSSLTDVFENLYKNLITLGASFINNDNGLLISMFYFSLLAPLIGIIFNKNRKSILLLYFLFSSLILTSFYSKEIYFYHINPFYLIILIILTYIISQIGKTKIFLAIFFILITSFLISKDNIYNIFVRPSELEASQNIAQAILKNSKDLRKIKILTCIEIHKDTCDYPTCTSMSMGIWFYLEKITKQRLGFLVKNAYENYQPYSDDATDKQIYYVCDYEINECLKNLNLNIKDSELIYSEDNYSLSLLKFYP